MACSPRIGVRFALPASVFILACIAMTTPVFSENHSTSEKFDGLVVQNVLSGDADTVLMHHGKAAFDRFRAIVAFGDITSLHSRKALAAVIEVAESDDYQSIRLKALETLGKMFYLDPGIGLMALQRAISSSDSEERISAISGMAKSGNDGKKAIPLLLKTLIEGDARIRDVCLQSLVYISLPGDINPEWIPKLLDLIRRDRNRAGQVMRFVAWAGKPGADAIAELLCGNDDDLTWNALYWIPLVDNGAFSQRFLNKFIKILEGNDNDLKAQLLGLLSSGFVDNQYLEVLKDRIAALLREELPVDAVCFALDCLGRTRRPEYLDEITRWIDKGDRFTRNRALLAIREYGVRAMDVRAAVERQIQENYNEISQFAAMTLWAMTREDRYMEYILKCLANSDADVVNVACFLLTKGGKDEKIAIPDLVRIALDAGDPSNNKSVYYAIEALRAINEDCAAVVPIVKRAIIEGPHRRSVRAIRILPLIWHKRDSAKFILDAYNNPDIFGYWKYHLDRDWDNLESAVIEALGYIDQPGEEELSFLWRSFFVGTARDTARKALKRIVREISDDELAGERKKYLESHEKSNAALVESGLEVLRGKREIGMTLQEKHGSEFANAHGSEEANLKYIRWSKEIIGAASVAETEKEAVRLANEVESEDDAAAYLKIVLVRSSQGMMPIVGIGNLIELWKYKGQIFDDLKTMLKTKLAGVPDVTQLYLGNSGVGMYLKEFTFDKEGRMITKWTRGEHFKIVEYKDGVWPRIVVDVVKD